MLPLPVIIKFYMLSFLLIDSISGFIRIYLEITNPIFNIGYWIRGPILFLFIYFYFFKLFKKKLFLDELLSMIMFLFFFINAIIYYLEFSSINMLVENLTYILRFQFLLFLYVFLKNRMQLSQELTKKIISINFIFFVINLSSGFLFGFGLESYRFEGTSKGMFQGGNPVSILNLIFFTFFLLDGSLRKKIIPVLFTIMNAFIIASKSVFGFIVPIYFALKRKALSLNKILAYFALLIILFFSFTILIDRTIELYESRFGLNIKKSISAAEKVGGLYKNQALNKIASINFRRYASLNIQMKESLTEPKTFILGKSFAGQNLFWRERGEFWFTNASMDFFDFFFKYGLIGTIILSLIFSRVSFNLFLNSHIRDKVAIILFFAYSFFGGHVIDSVTSGSLFYYLLANINSKNANSNYS
tara:strand:+ start:2224 stop:3471 length:1248 start_codon:yes stop_codon:yes gene_type:complete